MQTVKFNLNIPYAALKSRAKGEYIEVEGEMYQGKLLVYFKNLPSRLAEDIIDWATLFEYARERVQAHWQSRNNACAIGDLLVDKYGKVIASPIKEGTQW